MLPKHAPQLVKRPRAGHARSDGRPGGDPGTIHHREIHKHA
jgi:hypothetical protein